LGDVVLVAHDRGQVAPGGTLETLYLKPLAERVRAHGDSVHAGWQRTFHLLIDVKSDARTTYRAIHRALRAYRQMLTRFLPDGVRRGAVTVTISGNRDLTSMAGQRVRYAAYDGRLADLDSGLPASLVPLISDSWARTFTWRGEGPMPHSERRKLRDIVARAHRSGRRVRFWGTSDLSPSARANIREEGLAAGVDYLETDNLTELQRGLLAADPTPSAPLVEWWEAGR
jgi:hypothetical protein